IVAAGLLGPLVALALLRPGAVPAERTTRRVAGADGNAPRPLFSATILRLTAFLLLLSLSTSGISNFSVVALVRGYDVPLALANIALTAWLMATALGVLAGGAIADLTRRHGQVAAAGFRVTALLVLLVGTTPLPGVLLV